LNIKVLNLVEKSEIEKGSGKNEERSLHEKTRAAAAPRKPKKGAVSSPLNGAIDTATTSYRSQREKFRSLLCCGRER